jgi:hypothetical protein
VQAYYNGANQPGWSNTQWFLSGANGSYTVDYNTPPNPGQITKMTWTVTNVANGYATISTVTVLKDLSRGGSAAIYDDGHARNKCGLLRYAAALS